MKTLKKNSKVIRVKDNETTRFLADGYVFCPKSEWKSLKTKPTKVEATGEVVVEPKKKKKKK